MSHIQNLVNHDFSDLHRLHTTLEATQVDSKLCAIDSSRRVDVVYTKTFCNRPIIREDTVPQSRGNFQKQYPTKNIMISLKYIGLKKTIAIWLVNMTQF